MMNKKTSVRADAFPQRSLRTTSSLPAFLLFCAVAVLSASGPVQADLVIHRKHHTNAYTAGGRKVPAADYTSTVWLGKDRARIDWSADSSSIIRLDRNMIYYVSYRAKTYIRETIEPGRETVLSAVEDDGDMTVVNFKLPEVAIKVSFQDKARKKKIRGWNCQRCNLSYSIDSIGAKSTLWVTKDVQMDYAFYNRIMIAYLNDMNGVTAAYDELEKIRGLPVVLTTMRQIKGATVKSTDEILEVSEKTPRDSLYDIQRDFIRTGGR